MMKSSSKYLQLTVICSIGSEYSLPVKNTLFSISLSLLHVQIKTVLWPCKLGWVPIGKFPLKREPMNGCCGGKRSSLI